MLDDKFLSHDELEPRHKQADERVAGLDEKELMDTVVAAYIRLAEITGTDFLTVARGSLLGFESVAGLVESMELDG
jgi:hypothetical protein